MIKMLTAYTLEADEPEFALEEILELLDLENEALKYSAGFLFFHPDFLGTGVARHIATSLPFEVVGATTVCNLIEGQRDLAGLTVSVLTSDTIEFTASSLPGCQTYEEIVQVYKDCVGDRTDTPSLIFPFATSAIGDNAVRILDELTGGKTPLFGTNAVDNTADSSQAIALHNGTIFHEGLVLLAAWGEIKTKFHFSEINDDLIQKQRAVITKSDGHIIMSINDISPAEYLASIGIDREQASGNLHSIPFIVDLQDGTAPVARVFYDLTPEGHIVTGAVMPENATLTVGMLEKNDIIRLTNEAMDTALNSGKSSGMLLFPCVSHFWALEDMPYALIQDKLDGKIPYHVFYSGGEICPVYDEDGKMFNRFHSFTCVSLSFE